MLTRDKNETSRKLKTKGNEGSSIVRTKEYQTAYRYTIGGRDEAEINKRRHIVIRKSRNLSTKHNKKQRVSVSVVQYDTFVHHQSVRLSVCHSVFRISVSTVVVTRCLTILLFTLVYSTAQ